MGRQPSSYVNISVSPSPSGDDTQREPTARRVRFSDLRRPLTKEIVHEEQRNGAVCTEDNKILCYPPVIT